MCGTEVIWHYSQALGNLKNALTFSALGAQRGIGIGSVVRVKIWSKNLILESIKGRNSVANLRKNKDLQY